MQSTVAPATPVTPTTRHQPERDRCLRAEEIPLLGALDAADREAILGICERRVAEAGEPLFGEVEQSRDLYLVVRGAARITTTPKTAWDRSGEMHVRFIEAGEVLGELSFLDGQQRQASARAHEDCELLVLSREAFDHLAAREPRAALAFTASLGRIVSGRLRDAMLLWLSSQ